MTVLEIFVTDECWSCEESRRIAAEVEAHFPDVEVRLLDLSTAERPSHVFAAPTYLLDGQLVYLGNPRRQDLWQRLKAAAAIAPALDGGRPASEKE